MRTVLRLAALCCLLCAGCSFFAVELKTPFGELRAKAFEATLQNPPPTTRPTTTPAN